MIDVFKWLIICFERIKIRNGHRCHRRRNTYCNTQECKPDWRTCNRYKNNPSDRKFLLRIKLNLARLSAAVLCNDTSGKFRRSSEFLYHFLFFLYSGICKIL